MTNARNLSNRSTDFVSVKDYGAVGDGVTDDTAAIQAALNAGQAFFPDAGPYMINVPLVVSQNGTRMWSYCNTVIKMLNTAPYCGYTIVVNNLHDVEIENITLNCNVAYRSVSQGWTAATGGMSISGGSYNCRISHSTVVDCGIIDPPGSSSVGGGEAFTISVLEADASDTYNNTIENCTAVDPNGQLSFGFRMLTQFGLNIADSAFTRKVRNNTFRGNIIIGTSWNAIEIAGPAAMCNVIDGNIAYAPLGPSGIESDKGGSYNSFVGNIVERRTYDGLTANAFCAFRDQGTLGSGFPTRYATGNVWVNNVAREMIKGTTVASVGMVIDYSKDVTITNMSLSGFSDVGSVSESTRGVQLYDCSGARINGLNMDLTGCTGTVYAVLFGGNCSDISISNFRIVTPTVADGFILNSGPVTRLRISDGEIVGGTFGLRMSGVTTTIVQGYVSNVTFLNQSSYCINFSVAGTTFSGLISGCKFLPSGATALTINDWSSIIFDTNNTWNVAVPLPLTVASASTVTLPQVLNTFKISGTTGITDITATGWNGKTVHLIFTGALTVTDGSNLKLNSNFTTTADDVLTLSCDGTNWYEVARSAN